MAYSMSFVVGIILNVWIHCIGCQPIEDAIQFDDLSSPTAVSTLLSLCFLISVVAVIGFCVCCSNPNLKVSGKQNGIAASYETSNNLQLENTSEFTIFPPLSAVVMQPANSSDDKVTFEPLPEILSRSSTISQDSQFLRIAKFSGSFGKGLDDWFDDSTYKYFPRSQLQYHQELGNCWFGQVVSGEAQNITENEIVTKVIVKILKQDATPTDYVHFLQEIRPFRDLNHQNIIKLLGFCLEKDPYLFILEHTIMDLKTYLINHCEEAESLLHNGHILHLACNIADAVQHMHDHNFVHMDLAARNCYFTSDFVIKLGDYGTSVQTHKDEYYCRGSIALPLRWCDPDSLICTTSIIETKEINKTANIWSFGVFLWELFEFGKLPYFALTDEEVLQKVVLEQSCLLESPKRSFIHKERIYQIMLMCWRPVSSRPKIHEIFALLNYLFDNKNKISNITEFESRWTTLQPQITEHNFVISSNSQASNVTLKFENDFVPSLQNTIECVPSGDFSIPVLNVNEKEIVIEVPLKSQNLQNSVEDKFYKNDILESVYDDDDDDVKLNKVLYNKQNVTNSSDLKSVAPPFISEFSENLPKGQQFEMTECKVIHNTVQSINQFEEICIENSCSDELLKSNCIENKDHNHYLGNSESSETSNKEEISCNIHNEKNVTFTSNADKETVCQDFSSENVNPSFTFHDSKINFDSISLKSNSEERENNDCDYVDNTVIKGTNCDVQKKINQKYDCKSMNLIDSCDNEMKGNFDDMQINFKDKTRDDDTCEKNDADNKIIAQEDYKFHIADTLNYDTVTQLNEKSLIVKNKNINPLNNVEFLKTEDDKAFNEDIDKNFTDSKPFSVQPNIYITEHLQNNSDYTESEKFSFKVDIDMNDETNSNSSETSNEERLINEEQLNVSNVYFHKMILDEVNSDHNISSKILSIKEPENNEIKSVQEYNIYQKNLKDDISFNDDDECSYNNSLEIHNIEETNESTALNKYFVLKSNLPVDLYSLSAETNKSRMDTIPESTEICLEETTHNISPSSFQQSISPVDSIEQENLVKCDNFTQSMLEPIVVVKQCSISSEGEEYNLDDISDALSEINSVNNIEVFNSTTQNIHSELSNKNNDIILENSNRPGPSQLSPNMFATCTNYWNDKVQLINHSDINLKEESSKSHCNSDIVVLEDLDTGDKKDVISCYDTFQDPFETDEVLRVDTETNIAVLLDSSQSVIGFAPSKVSDMSNKQCIIDIQDNEILSSSERQNLSKFSNSFCFNGYKTSDVSTSSSCSASSDLSVDLERQSDTSSESDIVPEAHSVNNSHSYAESMDDIHFSQISSENTSDLLTVNDDNLSFETLENLLIKSDNIKKEYNCINNNLDDSKADFHSSIKKTNIEIKDTQKYECENLSPNRETYTPDFDSDTDDTSSTGTSCTSTSGSFECLYKSERMTCKTSEIINDDKEDGPETSIQIFSGTWDRKATPTKSSMKSPERKNGHMKKSVSFQEEDPPLFSYPPESEGSDDDSRGFDYSDDFFWNVDYTMYTDWDFQTSLDAEEIPEDIIEVEDPEQDDEYLSFRYKALPLRPFQVYTFTDITDDECSESASLKNNINNDFGIMEENLIKNNLEVKIVEDPCSSPVGSIPDEVCEEVLETFPNFTDIADISLAVSDDDRNMNSCSFEILEIENNESEKTNTKCNNSPRLEYDDPMLDLIMEDGNNEKKNSSSKYTISPTNNLSNNEIAQNTNKVDAFFNADANNKIINVINGVEEYEESDIKASEKINKISQINEATNIAFDHHNFIKDTKNNEHICDLGEDNLISDINFENRYLKKNNVISTCKKEIEEPLSYSNIYLINETENEHNMIFEPFDENKTMEDNIKTEFIENCSVSMNDKTENSDLVLDDANGNNKNESALLINTNNNVEVFSTEDDKFNTLSSADIFSMQYSEPNKISCNSENAIENCFISENKISSYSTNKNNDNFILFETNENSGIIKFGHSSDYCDYYKTDISHLNSEVKEFAYSVFDEKEFQTSQQNTTEASSSSKSTDDTSEQDSAISSSGEFSPTYSPSLIQGDFKNKDNPWDCHQSLLQFSHSDNTANDNINTENIDNIHDEKCISETMVAKCVTPIPTIVISDSDNVDNLQNCDDKFEQNGNVVLDRNSTMNEFCGENNNATIWENV